MDSDPTSYGNRVFMQILKPIPIPTNRELTKDDLPSEQQIQLLLKQNGREAQRYYAWRNALRVLPLISTQPLERTWQGHAVRHSFAVVRALAILQNQLREGRERVDFSFIADAARSAADVARAYAADDAARSADDAARAAAYAADAARAATHAFDAAVGAVKAATFTSKAAVYAAARASARAATYDPDLQRALLRQSILDFNSVVQIAAVTQIMDKPLWEQAPTIWQDYPRLLHHELENIGLGFLIDDVESLLTGEVILPGRIEKYNKTLDYSDDVVNDPTRLAVLFHGEEAEENSKENAKENPSVRVLLVGPGGAGKTSLFNLLLNRQKSPSDNATIAIDTQQIDLDEHREAGVKVDIEGKTNNIEILQWDFGGQSVFYNLHRGFMRRENCVYVLVVDSRHEQAPDDWLAQIQHYAQSDGSNEPARVLVVTNSYEGIEREQNHHYLSRKFEGLLTSINDQYPSPFFTLNCTQADARFDHFLVGLLHACKGSQRLIMPSTRKGIDALQREFSNKKAIAVSEFADSCYAMDTDNEDFLREKRSLENLGYLVDLNNMGAGRVADTQSDYLILDPKWIASVAYEAINHEQLRRFGGKISRDKFKTKVLNALRADKLNNEDKELIIQFLQAQGVAYPFTVGSQKMLFFPDAAPALEPIAVTSLFHPSTRWQLGKPFSHSIVGEIIIEYALPAFPMGLKSHLAIRLLSKGHVSLDGAPKLGKIDEPAQREQKALQDQKQQTKPPELDVWRDGLLATFEHGVTIVVFYHPAKHKLELKCLYAPELPASFNNQAMNKQKTPAHLMAKPIPELVLAEPLRILHQLINHEAIQGTNRGLPLLPMLIYERSDHHMRDAIFHKVPGYKIMEVTSNDEISSGRRDKSHDKNRSDEYNQQLPHQQARSTLTLFLASSSELREERDEFELFLRRENDKLINQGVYLKVIRWEHFFDAVSEKGLQEEYNQKVRDSNIFVSLFKTKVGKFTEEEFDAAYGAFINKGTPKIFTYFYDVKVSTSTMDKENINSLFDFKAKLEELKHYPTDFTSVDDLQNQFQRQLVHLVAEFRGKSLSER